MLIAAFECPPALVIAGVSETIVATLLHGLFRKFLVAYQCTCILRVSSCIVTTGSSMYSVLLGTVSVISVSIQSNGRKEHETLNRGISVRIHGNILSLIWQGRKTSSEVVCFLRMRKVVSITGPTWVSFPYASHYSKLRTPAERMCVWEVND